MKLLLSFVHVFFSLLFSQLTGASVHESFVKSPQLKLSIADQIIAEKIVSTIKLVEKGYVSKDLMARLIPEVEKSTHFRLFIPWLKAIKEIIQIKSASDFIQHCRAYQSPRETLPIEKVLEKKAANLCRELALESILREVKATRTISESASIFIQENLKFFLTKKNKKNFAFFLQSISSRPELLKKMSQDITAYSVQHQIVPSQDVLRDIEINEQLTKLIQDKGFNNTQSKNVFYAEFSKLIEVGYKSLDGKIPEEKIKEHVAFLKNFFNLNQDHLPVTTCLTRINDFSKSLFRAGHTNLSRDAFKFVLKKNNKDTHEDALFFYLWTYMSGNDFKQALKIADTHGVRDDVKKILDARLKFWIAYGHEKEKNPKTALSFYEDTVTQHPLSYYSIMAIKRIQALRPDSPLINFYRTAMQSEPTLLSFDSALVSSDYISSLVRLKAWAKIHSTKLISQELKRLRQHSIPEFLVAFPTEKQLQIRSDLHLINAQIILSYQNYLSSFRYIYEALDKREIIFGRPMLNILYPSPYISEIQSIINKTEIDPIIVLSLIRQESVFNPEAKSRVGARGLMQLMPATARRLKRSVREGQLSNPRLNIELGTKYLKNLMKRYDGNLVYVLSAYNAGESRVERWRGNLFDSDETILKNIESIPFLETRNYVKLIFRNIFFYKLLLEKEVPTDNSEHNKIFDVALGFKH
jgi:soluble lytic murein transglycosylase